MEDKEAGNLGSFSTLDGNLHTTQILSGSQVAERLPMLKCIESTAEALKALSSGKGNYNLQLFWYLISCPHLIINTEQINQKYSYSVI